MNFLRRNAKEWPSLQTSAALILLMLLDVFTPPNILAQELEITDISAEGNQIRLAWSPPIDGITIESIQLETQKPVSLFNHDDTGVFISHASFSDTNRTSFLRLRWRNGALAVYIPQPELPTQLLAYRPINTSNMPVAKRTFPPMLADVTGERLFIPEGQPISPTIPLAQFKNLKRLHLWGRQISDISFLSGMPRLEYVHLGGNLISNLAPAGSLSNLNALLVNGNRIGDLTPLTNLYKLKHLSVSNNKINNLSSLSSCTNLVDISITYNNIRDLSPLSSLKSTRMLYICGNPISDLNPLAGLTNLTYIWARSCSIQDISALSGLNNLVSIKLDCNEIEDLTPLASLSCMLLNLRSNQVHDISPLLETAANGGFIQHRACEFGLDLRNNPLSQHSIEVLIPELKTRWGIKVLH